MASIPTYIINLEKRKERKISIIEQFKNKEEFDFKIVKAIDDINGALGLWNTMVSIIKNAAEEDMDYVLICEDDHQFTKHYNKRMLFHSIIQSRELGADVLIGGVSSFLDALQVRENIFWIDKFNATQFIIVFRNFFNRILSYHFKKEDTADKIIYELTEKKFVIYPFVSTQKEFGYSDATEFNNRKGYVTQIFETSDMILSHIVKANIYYNNSN